MQHQSAENIFEINTNLGGEEHPPRFQAKDSFEGCWAVLENSIPWPWLTEARTNPIHA